MSTVCVITRRELLWYTVQKSGDNLFYYTTCRTVRLLRVLLGSPYYNGPYDVRSQLRLLALCWYAALTHICLTVSYVFACLVHQFD